MQITWEEAERAAGYYCAVRDLEEECEEEMREEMGEDKFYEGDHDGYISHPQWDERSDALADKWNLTPREDEVLTYALESGLCDYFGPEDIMEL